MNQTNMNLFFLFFVNTLENDETLQNGENPKEKFKTRL